MPRYRTVSKYVVCLLLTGMAVWGVIAGIQSSLSEQGGIQKELFDLLDSPSHVPKEEPYVHLAGGFFSLFDRRTGELRFASGLSQCEPAAQSAVRQLQSCVRVRIRLESLRGGSAFVYILQGNLILYDSAGGCYRCRLERLDYSAPTGVQVPYYRLLFTVPQIDGRGVMLIRAVEGTRPRSSGYLLLCRGEEWAVYFLEICGRSELQAEHHLCRFVERMSSQGDCGRPASID